ncbi:MAG: alpha-amylase family glycosyl hydrolase [Bacteroidota bacterium]
MRISKILILLIFCSVSLTAVGQVVTTDPAFPTADEPVTIFFDVTKAADGRAAGLLGLTDGVFLWSGAGSTANGDAFEFQPSGQTNFAMAFEPGRMTSEGNDIWSITITPRTYFGVPEGTPIAKLGLLLKNTGGSAQTEDVIINIFEADEFAVQLTSPTQTSLLVDEGETISIAAVASNPATFTLTADGNVIETQANTETFAFDRMVTETSGTVSLKLTADDGNGNTFEANLSYTLRTESVSEPIPAGIIRGINYDDSDDSKVTLCLQAPNKSSVYAIGDFSDWKLDAAYQMKKDGELFWVEISGLTAGEEYAFQYLVDESIYIGDPYADKILQPGDRFISEEIYPNLKEYPEDAVNSVGFYNTVSVFETGQDAYEWQVNNFEKPDQTELVVYELLVRDFFENGKESYENLIDTLSFIKSLGVNAIELMPITEFSGNDSWGYNPIYMFAPDKAYGTKNGLKAFIDAAHGLGIAVILDMVLNQQEQPSPLILLDFNTSTSQVTADNPYFNIEATHPFNVFYDMNHESTYTQSFADTVNHYWLNEYRFDGYRFDLSKGFTQTNYGQDVGAWSSFDQGRVDILKRMADAIWEHTPEAYVILEHFADNSEESELANHGMMLWGNLHGSFKNNILGTQGGDIRSLYHANRGFNDAHLVGYMESHDEQRHVYDALNDPTSNVADLDDALNRVATASALLYLVPGPKMLWQFGELGYDIDIDQNGRTGQKPIPWNGVEGLNYNNEANRQALRQIKSELIALKLQYSVFNTGIPTFSGNGDLRKQIVLMNEANTNSPASAEEMNAVVVANFETGSRNIQVNFPHTGKWYDYFADSEVSGQVVNVEAGGFKVFTDFNLGTPIVTSTFDDLTISLELYPNPAISTITIPSEEPLLYYFVYSLNGAFVKKGKFANQGEAYDIDVAQLGQGIYVVETISRAGERDFHKFVKE